jgi:hypothetical protein
MLQFLRIVAGDARANPAAAGAPPGQVVPWLVVAASSLAIPWALYPAVSGESLVSLVQPEALWKLLWPMALGAGALFIVSRFPKLPGAIPEGDIVVLAEAGGPTLDRALRAIEQADATLRRWPVAGVSLLLIAILLGGALMRGA